MKEEIDWKKELIESWKFNKKFSNNILENGAKIICKKSIWDIYTTEGEKLEIKKLRHLRKIYTTFSC